MIAILDSKAKLPTLLALKTCLPETQALKTLSPRTLLLGSLFAAALTSCSILPEREPTTIYQPARPALSTHADWPSANWSLLVARPAAGVMYESDRITVRPAPGAVQVYKGASWSDAVPDLVQTALVRSFEDSQKILTVGRPGGAVRGEYQLVTELRSFDSIYAQAGQTQAVIEVHAKLIYAVDGEVVAARTFRESETSSSEEVGAVVDAFSRSLARLSGQMVGWTLTSGNQHAARQKKR